mgnify:CR=1 FL=1
MALFLTTAPLLEPLSLAQAKTHLRVDVDDENGLIDTLIRAARGWVETFIHRSLIATVWDWKLDAFPDACFELPLPPVSAVTSITYTDTAGVSQTWASTLYTTSLPTGPKAAPARITPIYGGVFPSTRTVMDAVTVRFTAGYGTEATSVPADIRSAMLLMIGHWYERREPVNIGNIVTPIPMTVESLLWPYKAF